MDTTANFEAHWNYWKGMPTATIRQFVKLSYGLDPHRDPLHEVGGGRSWSLLKAVQYKYIPCLGQEPSHDPELPSGDLLHPVDQVIDIRQATAWAVEKGWDIPARLRETFLPGSPTSTPSNTSEWGLLTPEQKKQQWNAMTPEQRRQKGPELVKVHGGNKSAAAGEVGISANALRRYLPSEEKPSEGPMEGAFRSTKYTDLAGLTKPKQGKGSRR